MKINTPLPQPLPKECLKAAKTFKSFVDSGNNGLDGVIPRSVLYNAKGLAIFTVFKAGFLFSARAGAGIVIAKLDDGTWSAPSAIGTAGVGVGGQAGAEMTDFLVVLNSRSAVRSFMSAGSLTLGGNMSIAVGPLGRNGEALGSLNTSGKVAAMYSYSKTRGLFGGVSIEGSVIVERQDANAQAYGYDVSVKALLSGAIPPPEWAQPLIRTLESCTGLPSNRPWVQEFRAQHDDYAFDSVESPRQANGQTDLYSADALYTGGGSSRPPMRKSKSRNSSFGFTPASWGKRKGSGSYFADEFHDPGRAPMPSDISDGPYSSSSRSTPTGRAWEDTPSPRFTRALNPTTGYFDTKFDSDFATDEQLRRHPPLSMNRRRTGDYDDSRVGSPYSSAQHTMTGSDVTSNRRAYSAYAPPADEDPFQTHNDVEDFDYGGSARTHRMSVYNPPPKMTPKLGLTKPLNPSEGVARAIALFNFDAVQSGDLSFKKGQVITVTKRSDDTNTWWTGKLDGREGMFPANFVEVV
ncbi:DUF500-domain-containing protein [Laetiporus sulphureus 93-53]|uniref:DUF500-domain-containing protein n=1 Tax=Laetiporus sulphureus 93-53 TaxID=1314785 RepID=A0A165EZC9_9APHY|nr:DUF500-domain-containing protein [Laetiporus sulphureus 93-53]KZT08035.1 DUF500-domain-containing protein [Laetiporus sulphureus 93-53]